MPRRSVVTIRPIQLKHFTSLEETIDYAHEVLTESLRAELSGARDPSYRVIKNKLHDITAASTRLVRAHRALIEFAQSAAALLSNTPPPGTSQRALKQLERQRERALALAGKPFRFPKDVLAPREDHSSLNASSRQNPHSSPQSAGL